MQLKCVCTLLWGVLAVSLGGVVCRADEQAKVKTDPAPVRALLICGGCCHDYDSQKEIIKRGMESLAHIEVTVVHQGGAGTSAEIELYKDPQWADAYDVILHDECFSDDKDPAWLARILSPHRAGKPGVVIHCAMHCYRVGNDDWFQFCGVTSHGHGPHYPHEVRNVLATHEVMEGFGAAWANPAGELYRIAKLWDTATPLATAKDRENGEDQVCVWTNDYHGTRVFGTTLGHHNETVEDPTFMMMLTRGTLWAAGKSGPEYFKPVTPRLEPVNLALQKTVTASSEQRDQNNLASMATDGKRATRWCASDGSFPQWVQVDLGVEQLIQGVRIEWESDDASYVYTLKGSTDGVKYNELFTTGDKGLMGRAADHPLEDAKVRYIRVECERASPGSWASIRELKVHGDEFQQISEVKDGANHEAALLGECRLPEGFDATVFAAPPAVNYPVFVAAAPDGTLFVSSDKNGSLDREPRRGAVIRLKDLDGDGRADQSNLFVDNVDSPRGLVWDQDRLYLLHPPHLSAFIDDNGDGVSDRQEVLVRDIAFGFKDRPADHTSNGVTMGIDGWLYLAIGDFGFVNATGSDGRTLQFRGGGVVRVRPDGTGLEIYSRGTRNILEVAVDPLLRGYARDNTNDGGGWDVRMHHFTGLEDHGYPRRYVNFANEVIAPRADYGGGSGCGALFLDEPGFPEGFSNCIYTADWGRQQIYRHSLNPVGATVDVDQSEFLGMERVTDLDVDANSQIYASSWKGATFTYAGEDVGYIVRLVPKGFQQRPLPDSVNGSDAEWLDLIRDESHRRRLEAQRLLVRRSQAEPSRGIKIADDLLSIAQDSRESLKSRIAAMYGYSQVKQGDSVAGLVALAKDSTIAAWSVRALTDSISQWNDAALATVEAGLQSTDSRLKLESLVAAARYGDYARGTTAGTAGFHGSPKRVEALKSNVVDCLVDSDSTIQHTAVVALASLRGWQSALNMLDDPNASEEVLTQAVFVLQSLHDAELIDSLIERLHRAERGANSYQHRLELLQVLCRLHFREGEWNGSSWGTRPDTRGPYYQPEPWGESNRIASVLDAEVERADAAMATIILNLMVKNRMDVKGLLESWMEKDDWTQVSLEDRKNVLMKAGALPSAAIVRLVDSIESGLFNDQQLVTINEILLRQDDAQAVHGIVAILRELCTTKSSELGSVWKQCFESDNFPKAIANLSDASTQSARDRLAVGLAIAAIASRQDQANRTAVIDGMNGLWTDESLVKTVLEQLQNIDARSAESLVRRALIDGRPTVQATGQAIAKAWDLADLDQWAGPKIAGLDKEDLLREVVAMEGNQDRGAQVFSLLGCAKCHDVTPTESLRGPYLPNVAKTYRRDQLVEAILMPSKSIAQGFVQNIFLMDDGRTLAGFVTSEGATKITIRNAEGQSVEIDVEGIEQRKESTVSVMPEGLADPIPVAALSDLVSYLQSLGSK